MAKSSSPVRLQEQLMRSAAMAGALHQRSAAQQVEYWSALGREVAGMVDPEQLLAVQAGLARLRVEPVRAAAVPPAQVFAALDHDRLSGSLAQAVCSAPVRYQACRSYPGYLERINADGSLTIGCFTEGVFRPTHPAAA
jgi:hypothetical protein